MGNLKNILRYFLFIDLVTLVNNVVVVGWVDEQSKFAVNADKHEQNRTCENDNGTPQQGFK